MDEGYASHVIDFLDREALLSRKPRVPILTVDWLGLLRRWSQDYTPFRRSGVSWFLAPRGLTWIEEKLRRGSASYVSTGSRAAGQFAPVTPTRTLLCYADHPGGLTEELDLKPAQTGANIGLLMPFDPIVYDRTQVKAGITVAAPTQIAADLLTSPGRGPNEAEALMEWMSHHEDAWRASSSLYRRPPGALERTQRVRRTARRGDLVGAQAIYLYTEDIEFPVAEYTTDADVTLDPQLLKQTPEIESALTKSGFHRGRRVGAGVGTTEIQGRTVDIDVDLMVPEALGGPGRRAAQLTGHAKEVARKARGLEAALTTRRS